MSKAVPTTTSVAREREESKTKPLNAEQATAIAVDFIRRLGNRRKLRPKSATLQNEIYIVEIELKKATAKIQIDPKTREIREYSIEPKAEETSTLPVNFRAIMLMVVISVVMYLILGFLNIQSLLK